MKFFVRFKDGVEFTTDGDFSFYPNLLETVVSVSDYYRID